MVKKAPIVHAYQVNLYCDKCGKRMSRGTSTLLSDPTKYVYLCECGETAISEKLYPYQIVEFDEGNAEIITYE